MPERLVDVEKQGAKILHTFPVTISTPAVEEEAFKAKALEAAANVKLVPNEELESLNAKMHVSRGGQLTPFGDPHGVLAETKAGLDQVVRERAYLLWERAGRPNGRADDFWHQAQHQRFCAQHGSGSITVGGSQETGLQGAVAHLAIWNRLLSLDEIASIWSAGASDLSTCAMYHSFV